MIPTRPTHLAPAVQRAAAVSAITTMMLAGTSTAHVVGPETGILGVVTCDEDGPSILRLTEGLAVRDGERWWYVCPALVGMDALPLAEAAPGGDSWVVGATSLFTLRPDGTLEERGPGLPDPSRVVALASGDSHVFALELRAEGSTVHRLSASGSTPILKGTDPWSLLAAGAGRLYLGRSESAGLDVLTVSSQGTELDRAFVPLDLASAVTRLRPAGEALFVSVRRENGDSLHVLSGSDAGALASPSPIWGPVATEEGTLWIATGGRLGRLDGSTVSEVSTAERITCVDEHAGHAYACAETRLYGLTEAGLGGQIADLSSLDAPAGTPPGPEGAQCGAQWERFREDLIAAGALPTKTANPLESDASAAAVPTRGAIEVGGACSLVARQRNASHGHALVIYGVLVLLGRLRRCASS
jgi:hypothetical protein